MNGIDVVQDVVCIDFELNVSRQLGYEVVVVGVEPFGHFHCGLSCVTTCQIEGLRQCDVIGIKIKALGDATEHQALVEHLVVKRKVTDGDMGQLRIDLGLPIFGFDAVGDILQGGDIAVSAPK